MNEIRGWAAMICMAALAVALLQFLVPGKGSQPAMRMVLGAFLVCAMLSPFRNGIPDFDFSAVYEEVDTGISDVVQEQFYEAAERNIRSVVAQTLYESGILCKNIELFMDTDGNNGIVINKVVVYLSAEDAARGEEIEADLEEVLGLETEVAAYGG